MKNTLYCIDCENSSFCNHTDMRFCDETGQPAWMALDDLWDEEKDECSSFKHRKRST